MSSDNYRLIAITSLILKLFDGVLLELCGKDLKPHSYNLGFNGGNQQPWPHGLLMRLSLTSEVRVGQFTYALWT